jgi:flavin reductase (DIM6/NTAB) family NADH-FMN oxidoreductase RutF
MVDANADGSLQRGPKAAAQIHDVDVNDEPFDQLMAMLDHPVFVVTTQADGQPSGCLVSFATQVSEQPSRFLVGISKRSYACEVASRSGYLAVHVLLQRHRVLAELFGSQTGGQTSKSDPCSWRSGPWGMPILDDSAAWFVGRTLNQMDFGDHVGYLLEPVATWAPESTEDLLYLSDFDDLEPGSGLADCEPRDAPRRYGVVRFTLDRV